MKNILYTFLLFFIIITIKAQEKPSSKINLVAAYDANSNTVNLRFLPSNKAIYQLGAKQGFVVSRAIVNAQSFDLETMVFNAIGEVKAYDNAQWQAGLNKTNNELALAYNFYKDLDKPTVTLDLDKGIEALREQKSKADLSYTIFVMEAIKNKAIAKALGITFEDKKVSPNQQYIYKISLKEAQKKYEIESTLFLIETIAQKNTLQKIYVRPLDSALQFSWEESDAVSGVLVSRKNSNTGKWEALNKMPIYTLGNKNTNGFKDKNLQNNKTYNYRFYGFNPFGEKILFGETSGTPIDLTAPKTPIFKSVRHHKPDEVLITWELQQPIDKDLKGFLIARGTANKGKFNLLHKKLLHKSKHSFIDKTFEKHKANYYIIQAVDNSGNISSTIPAFVTIIDSIPPVKPIISNAVIDSLGKVKITIKPSNEKDLMGYRLFRANGKEHEFSVIQEGFNPNDTSLKKVQTVFSDTISLRTLTQKVYYKVVALDSNFNQSKTSDIYTLKRPDITPPTSPVFTNVKVYRDKIKLVFALSKSRDVAKQILYRKTNLKSNWEQIAILQNRDKEYLDTKIQAKKRYYYSLRAQDKSGLYSDYAQAVSAKTYDDGVRVGISKFKIYNTKNKINLSWSYPKMGKNTYFVVYKKDKKGNLTQYKRVDKTQFTEQLKAGKYTYAVKVFTGEGGASLLSELKTVVIK
jgi:hypothetical protein